MTTKSEFSVLGLAHKLFLAGEAEGVGITAAEWNTLAENRALLWDLRDLLRGGVTVVRSVDLDADPFIPDGWSVVEHHHGGQLEFDPAKIALFLSDNQKGGKWIKGDDLREELKDRPVFNANLLDFLLVHPHLIPDDWKGKAVYFWGTIYRDVDGNLYVRCLCWGGGAWGWFYVWLDGGWDSGGPAAVPASIE